MIMILTNSRERGRFLRFAVVGAIGAVVDFGTFNILATFLKMPVVLASVISFTAAILSNFLWNRFWTYPDSRSKPVLQQLMQFAMISVIGLAIRTPIIALLEGPLGRFFVLHHFAFLGSIPGEVLGNNLALAIAVLMVMFWNFFVNRYWTYGDVESG